MNGFLSAGSISIGIISQAIKYMQKKDIRSLMIFNKSNNDN